MDQSQGQPVPDQGVNPMHFARRPEPHASKGTPVTSDDLVPQVLTAIEETERKARGSGVVGWATYLHADGSMKYTSPVSGGGGVWVTAGAQTEPDSVQVIFDERAVLRRCAADREIAELHDIVWRDIGWLAEEDGEVVEEEAELPVCGLCVERHSSFPRREDVPVGPCRTVRLLARGYGISADEETPWPTTG